MQFKQLIFIHKLILFCIFFLLQGYRDEMQSEEMSSLVPPGLQDKADILFGNLHELYAFHSETFLKDLENCISTTELVALCFVQRVSNYQSTINS